MWFLELNRRTKDGTWKCFACKAKLIPRLIGKTIKCGQCGQIHRHSKKYLVVAVVNTLLVMVVALMGWYLIQKEILAWYFVFFIFIVPVPGLWQLAAWQRRGESLEVITNKLHSNT
jgi:hypothetical protein